MVDFIDKWVARLTDFAGVPAEGILKRRSARAAAAEAVE
jgi:hypothetical protein